LAAALIAVFAIANYAVQTHIHGAAMAPHSAAAGPSVSALDQNGPADNDEQHCPLCQEYLIGGSFLSPAALIVALPALAGTIDVVRLIVRWTGTSSHDWQSRGPPRSQA
jgi:hypothetical protein